jgi:hypothetical protein
MLYALKVKRTQIVQMMRDISLLLAVLAIGLAGCDGVGTCKRSVKSPVSFSQTNQITLSIDSMVFLLDLDTGETMDPPASTQRDVSKMDIHPDQYQPYQIPSRLIGLGLRGCRVKPEYWWMTAGEVLSAITHKELLELRTLEYDEKEEATFLFCTCDGTIGVLQIIGVSEKPRGLSIRYKTLSNKYNNSR